MSKNKTLKYKYTAFLTATVKSLVSSDNDTYLALASADRLKGVIPEFIKGERNIDLLPIAASLANVARANKNGDVISAESGLSIYKNFINRPINVEHKRKNICGHIINASLCKFDSEDVISEEEAKGEDVFNIAIAGVIYKVINDKFAEYLEEASDPESEKYNTCSLSWEIGFSEYDILLGSKYVSEGKIIENGTDEYKKLLSYLTCNKGKGFTPEGEPVFRLVKGDIFPLGAAITLNPAANVKGIFVEEGDEKIKENDEESNEEANSSIYMQAIKAINDDKEHQKTKIIANILQKNVNTDESITISNANILENTNLEQKNTNKPKIMTFKKIEDITDENFKEGTASAIKDFLTTEISRLSSEYKSEIDKEKSDKEALKQSIANAQQAVKDLNESKEQMSKELSELKSAEAARKEVELLANRMGELNSEYEFNDEENQVLASEIKGLNDEAFAAKKEKMKVLFKDKNKFFKKSKESKEGEKVKEEAKASADTNKTELELETALASGEKETNKIPNAGEASKPSFLDKFAKSFEFNETNFKFAK